MYFGDQVYVCHASAVSVEISFLNLLCANTPRPFRIDLFRGDIGVCNVCKMKRCTIIPCNSKLEEKIHKKVM